MLNQMRQAAAQELVAKAAKAPMLAGMLGQSWPQLQHRQGQVLVDPGISWPDADSNTNGGAYEAAADTDALY